MTYTLEVWDYSSHLTTILKQQKRAVRAISGASSTTHCRPLFKQHSILTVLAAYILQYQVGIHKTKDWHPRQGDIHTYDTRNREHLKGKFSRLATTSSNTTQLKIYNTLPNAWKTKTLKCFKRTLAFHLCETTPYTIEDILTNIPKL